MAATVADGEAVNIEVEGKSTLPVVFFKNSGSSKGVIVLQEWWGMNQQIQDEAKEIAQDGGFTTIVPDLYRGKIAKDREEAGHLMSNLDWQGALGDIQACAKFLQSKGCTKVGVTGFCMGGALSMAAAGKVEEIAASAPFYGICRDELCGASMIKKPIQFHFGTKDEVVGFSDRPSQIKLKEKLDAANIEHEFHLYDAGHAFTNKTNPNYDEKICHEALNRMYAFFQNKLS